MLLEDVLICETEEDFVRYLGLFFQYNIYDKHLEQMKKKMHYAFGTLMGYYIRHSSLNMFERKNMYVSLVRGSCSYACEMWAGTSSVLWEEEYQLLKQVARCSRRPKGESM